jgi:hypothetical protein
MQKQDRRLALLAAGLVGLCALLYGLLVLIREDPADRPHMSVLGASFIFNYRVADVYMGFTAVPMRPVPVGSVLEATFTDPASGQPLVVRERVGGPDRRIAMRSPSVRGVAADTPYPVTLRLLERETEAEIWSHEFAIVSGVSDETVPDRPLTVGPGYQRPPASPDPQ